MTCLDCQQDDPRLYAGACIWCVWRKRMKEILNESTR